jgi:hypothetical protein
MKTTCIIHIFNEEYLLPFWLRHHKELFDYGIIINYYCDDNSLQICKEICPEWKIVDSRNSCFKAEDVDSECMDIERSIDGFKMILNVTEFLITYGRPLHDILKAYENQKVAIKLQVYSPHTLNKHEPKNNYDFFKNILEDFRFSTFRNNRFLHNHETGCYGYGRHNTSHYSISTNDLCVLWAGFYPMNDNLMKRKLQIKQHIPECNRIAGLGFHHLKDKEGMIQENKEHYNEGVPLVQCNPKLHEYITHLASTKPQD